MARIADPAIRTALIEAAAARISVGGVEALSVRQVAHDVGASTQAVYTHFGSKDDLVAAVVAEAFDRLTARMRSVVTTDDPAVDLVEIGRAYRANAREHAHLYRVMFQINPLALADPSSPDVAAQPDAPGAPAGESVEGLAAFGVMLEAVERCVDAGIIDGDAGHVALQLWSTSHGVVSLELAGFLGPDAAELYDAATSATFEGVRRAGDGANSSATTGPVP